jgi:AraC-like DNA-binding protein
VQGKLLTIKEWEEVARKADYNPGKMAVLCSISERQMQRLFQQHVKCTPSRWLRQLQCRLAKQLIAKGYSNKAVAAELRFSSQSHFCREFKKVFGTSPKNFARAQDGNAQSSRKISRESWTALEHTPVGWPEGGPEKGGLRGNEAALPPKVG